MDKKLLAHIIGETVIIGGASYIAISKLKKLEDKINQSNLELTHVVKYMKEMLDQQANKITILESTVRDLTMQLATVNVSIQGNNNATADIVRKIHNNEHNIQCLDKELSDAKQFIEHQYTAFSVQNRNDRSSDIQNIRQQSVREDMHEMNREETKPRVTARHVGIEDEQPRTFGSRQITDDLHRTSKGTSKDTNINNNASRRAGIEEAQQRAQLMQERREKQMRDKSDA